MADILFYLCIKAPLIVSAGLMLAGVFQYYAPERVRLGREV